MYFLGYASLNHVSSPSPLFFKLVQLDKSKMIIVSKDRKSIKVLSFKKLPFSKNSFVSCPFISNYRNGFHRVLGTSNQLHIRSYGNVLPFLCKSILKYVLGLQFKVFFICFACLSHFNWL